MTPYFEGQKMTKNCPNRSLSFVKALAAVSNFFTVLRIVCCNIISQNGMIKVIISANLQNLCLNDQRMQ